MVGTTKLVCLFGEQQVQLEVRFRSNLKQMFGDWVAEENIGDEAAPDFNIMADDDAPQNGEAGGDDFCFDSDSVPEEPCSGDCDTEPHGPNNADYPAFADPYEINLSRAVYISGPHHIIHNLQEGFGTVLVQWVWFMDLLKHICRLLTNRWTKRRLLQECFSSGPAQVFSDAIRSFHDKVYDKRWGTAMAAVNNLLPLFTGIRFGWDLTRFTHGRVQHNDDDDEHSCDLDKANTAIESLLFWGYCLMADVFAWLFLYLSHWFDSCPCHCTVPDNADLTRRERRQYYRDRLNLRKCCMVCRRAPDFACGAVMVLLTRLLEMLQNGLLIELAGMGLLATDVAVIMRDFAAARRHVFIRLVMEALVFFNHIT